MNIELSPQIIPATVDDTPIIQNLGRFYVYDASRDCGFSTEEWACPPTGLYESSNFISYFEDPARKAFLIKVNQELAGFVLLNKVGTAPQIDWNMGEFFIIAKFQRKGIGKQVAQQIWKMFPGFWEVAVQPDNNRALGFWRNVLSSFTDGLYSEEIKIIDYDKLQPKRHIFSLDTKQQPKALSQEMLIRPASIKDVPDMVALSHEKRRAYENIQPRFWKFAKDADAHQTKWFQELLDQPNSLIFLAESNNKIKGFIIGQVTQAPGVYDPGGLTLMIDDFCVQPSDWKTIGYQLLTTIKEYSKSKGVVQIVVVTGQHDESKRQFLQDQGLSLVSEWYVGSEVDEVD